MRNLVASGFIALSLGLVAIVACTGDEVNTAYADRPTEAEYVKSCRGSGACNVSEDNCKKSYACLVDLFSAYKLRDVMQCQAEQKTCQDCLTDVVDVKYSKDQGDLMRACGIAKQNGCLGFDCEQPIRLYRDDLAKDLLECYQANCSTDPLKVVKCLNVTAFAKASKCSTACCTGGKFYQCPDLTTVDACFKGDTSKCAAVETRDELCRVPGSVTDAGVASDAAVSDGSTSDGSSGDGAVPPPP